MDPRLLGQSQNVSQANDYYLNAGIEEIEALIAAIDGYQMPELPPQVYEYVQGTLTEIRNRAVTLLTEVSPDQGYVDVTGVPQ